MDGYNESEDIDDLLRSALRGGLTNATDTTAGVPTPSADPEDPAARR